ncbi:MAG: thiamine phosphate synthase [Leptonema sp. (in: bacteria)]
MEVKLNLTLYPIVDIEFIEKNEIPNQDIEILLQQVDFFQLRIKNKKEKEILKLVQEYKNKYNKKIILNDYYEYKELVDGVHLGFEDLLKLKKKERITLKKNLAKNLPEWIQSKEKFILGFSTHNLKQFSKLHEEYREVLGYLAIGPMFSTTTKDLEYPLIPKEELDSILHYCVENRIQASLVFIGGICNSCLKDLYTSFNVFRYFENKKIYYASISNFLTKRIVLNYP